MAPIDFKFILSHFKFDHTTGEYFKDQSVISTRGSFSRTTSVQCVSQYMGAKQKNANVSLVFFWYIIDLSNHCKFIRNGITYELSTQEFNFQQV